MAEVALRQVVKKFGDVEAVPFVHFPSAAVDPLKDPSSQPGGLPESPEIKKQMAEAFKGLRIAFKLETPMEVVESNATRREGHTLYWEYDFATMEKMTPEQAQMGIRVRLRK